ncbi:Uncharacterised protein r2_g1628 [Pycnogonum litorale]
MSTSEESTAIDAVALRLPVFWPADPSLWFAHVEGQFRIRHITSEATKYGNVLSSLPPDTASEVRDLIITPPADEPYTVLKNAVISRTSGTKPQWMKQLLTTEELGDRKPTQLLRRMEHLMDGYNIDQQPLFKEVFLSRLPSTVRAVLATTPEGMSMSDQAALADRVMEAAGHLAVNQAQASSSDDTASLRQEVAELKNLLLTTVQARRGPSTDGDRDTPPRRRSLFRSWRPIGADVDIADANTRQGGFSLQQDRSSNSDQPRWRTTNSPFCYYHQRFGARARKCQQPCDFPPAPASGNDNGGGQ